MPILGSVSGRIKPVMVRPTAFRESGAKTNNLLSAGYLSSANRSLLEGVFLNYDRQTWRLLEELQIRKTASTTGIIQWPNVGGAGLTASFFVCSPCFPGASWLRPQ